MVTRWAKGIYLALNELEDALATLSNFWPSEATSASCVHPALFFRLCRRLMDMIPWKQKTARKDKIYKQIENTRINDDFLRDSAVSPISL